MHTHNCKHTAQIQRQFIRVKGIRGLWLIFCHFHKRDKFYEYLFAFLHTKTRLKEKNSLPRTTNYSWLSLSRTRLSRITAYLEVKIWSLPKRELLTPGKKILWKRGEIAPKEQFLHFSTIFLIHISLTSRVQLHIYLLIVVVRIIFSSVLQILYVEVRISRSV